MQLAVDILRVVTIAGLVIVGLIVGYMLLEGQDR
jgi:hypothetical protein